MKKEELEKLKIILLDHCHDMGILKKNAEKKKEKAILDSLVIAIINVGLNLQEVRDCINDARRNQIINLDFFENGGNLFETYINSKWKEIAKELFSQRSIGLGTPNAASGEGELMFLFLSPKIKKPTKGDLEIGGKIIELKGEKDVRVMGEIRGNDFRIKTLKICHEFNLISNKANKSNIDAVEIEKLQHFEHWKGQLAKLPLQKQKEFINKWLGCLDNKFHIDSAEKIFNEGLFVYSIFVEEIIKILYSSMVEDRKFDKLVILGNGANSKILSNDINDFNKKIDIKEIIPVSDYFRINQNYNVGWYIS